MLFKLACLPAQNRGLEEAAVVSYGNDIDENNPKNKNEGRPKKARQHDRKEVVTEWKKHSLKMSNLRRHRFLNRIPAAIQA
jgi:hypothetical protein